MDRIINVKVGGNHLSKDNKNAGVKGEANVTRLRMSFDEGWDGYAKKVTFWDALGGNPVERTLTTDLIENIVEDARVYLVPIPSEPLAIAGELTFVVDGYIDGKRQRSVADNLIVKDSPYTEDAGEPTDPTPTQAEQLQVQIDKIMDGVQDAAISKEQAQQSASSASMSYLEAMGQASSAQVNAYLAMDYANRARESADKAEEATTRNPVILEGYWYIWDAPTEQYINTRIKAQAGSIVYCGDTPPDYAAVWIQPDGEQNIASAPTKAFVNILGGADNWIAEDVYDANNNVIGTRYGQVVNVNNAVITPYSKVDLQITSEQMVIFHEKDVAFVAENEDGVVTIYCIGSIPQNDYTLQAIVTEVKANG